MCKNPLSCSVPLGETMKRNAVVAGQFYERNTRDLQSRLKQCFLDKRGPQQLPKKKKLEPPVKGLVVPHAGYIYSGAIAAHAYKELTEHGFADSFIILGPNHTGMGSGVSLMTEGSWETPLGTVSINETLAKQLWTDIIDNDVTAHLHEHSIEVQLPFLQFCASGTSFSFVPICMAMQDLETVREVGTVIAKAITQMKKRVAIIASSDFSHVGFNYMTTPPGDIRVDVYAEQQDKHALDAITAYDPARLLDVVYRHNISMCGYGPVATMLTATKILSGSQVKLLKYGSSYEVSPGDSCVGYGALAVY
jgi:AmmeMemoRadiSam system protein B